MIENITTNMNEAGYNGNWMSYVKDMKCYRLLISDDLTMIAYNQDMTLVTPQEYEDIRKNFSYGAI